jgi:ATP-dependent RNA helicase RhlE
LPTSKKTSDKLTPAAASTEATTPAETGSGFSAFNLSAPLQKALKQLKFDTPTPVQTETIPHVMNGRDVLSTAQTGTGKTAAFVLPIMNDLLKGQHKISKQTLILVPTRELALQIQNVVIELGQFVPQIKSGVIIGGSGYAMQSRTLLAKPSFVVGTPGRLIDQIKLGNLKLDNIGTLVLDEADRLLDMGFEPQIEAIISRLPVNRQTLLFSATLPAEIEKLARRYMKDPIRVSIGAHSKPVDKIEQKVVPVRAANKPETLIREIDKVAGSIIVFAKTKSRTESVAKALAKAGHRVARIHGDRSQNQRNEAIRGFHSGEFRILVATDIAARGIDVPHIKYVINYDLPMAAEDYIHRIGRTGRAGATGVAIAFVTPEEKLLWAKIYRLMYGKWPEGALEIAREHGQRTQNQKARSFAPSGRAGPGRSGPGRAGPGGRRPSRDGSGSYSTAGAGGTPRRGDEGSGGNNGRPSATGKPGGGSGGRDGGPTTGGRGAAGGRKGGPGGRPGAVGSGGPSKPGSGATGKKPGGGSGGRKASGPGPARSGRKSGGGGRPTKR